MKLAKIFTKSAILLFLPIGLMFGNINLSSDQEQLLKNIPPDQRDSIIEKMNRSQQLEEELNEVFTEENVLIERSEKVPSKDEQKCEECIFGYDYFKFAPTTFAPLNNIPISSNYILGPGDKLEINLYGTINLTVSSYISRTGEISLPNIGPVNLLGLNFDEAIQILKNRVALELPGTEASITLQELRSISVYVLGEAYNPGQYTMSGLSTVINALFISGGVSEKGSLRNIQIKRNDQVIATYDFYDFLLKGSLEADVKLIDGDLIFIPFIETKVRVGGAFRRPHFYEIVEGETINDVINLAGGFSSLEVLDSNKIEFSTFNKIKNKREIFTFDTGSDSLTKVLKDGDTVNLSSSTATETKTVMIKGQVAQPGEYTFVDGDRVLDVLERAGGYTDSSFSEGAIFLRKEVAKEQRKGFLRSADQLEQTIADTILSASQVERSIEMNEFTFLPASKLIDRLRKEEPLGRMVVDLDYLNLKKDPYLNFELNDGDEIHIPRRPNFISVVGEVLSSTTLMYNPNNSVDDYLKLSGGVKDTADDSKIFVVYPDGKSRIYNKNIFGGQFDLLPGSTIVVSRSTKSYDATTLARIITPILADLATSAAAIAAIND